MNYEKDIKIDSDGLDVEWLNQASLSIRYGKHWADCVTNLSRAEEALKIKQADLTDMINQSPEKYLGAGVKPTVGNIESFIIRNEEYIEVKEDVREKQYELNIALIAKNEVSNTRKSALENLVRLNGQNYFAGPSVPRDLSYEASQKEVQKKADSGIAEKMIRRTKNK